ADHRPVGRRHRDRPPDGRRGAHVGTRRGPRRRGAAVDRKPHCDVLARRRDRRGKRGQRRSHQCPVERTGHRPPGRARRERCGGRVIGDHTAARRPGGGLMQVLFDDIGFAIVLTGILAAGSTALLGSFLVVRGQALLTDAISHGIVLGIAVTFLVAGVTTGPLQLLGAGAAGVMTVLLTEALSASGRVRRDAATGLVFPAMFALGILLLSLCARDVHVDPHTVLLGEIGYVWLDRVIIFGLSVPRSVAVLGAMSIVNVLFVAAFYERLSFAAFDEVQAGLRGMRPRALTIALLGLTSMTAVAALDAVGVVLFIAFA